MKWLVGSYVWLEVDGEGICILCWVEWDIFGLVMVKYSFDIIVIEVGYLWWIGLEMFYVVYVL